MFKKATKRQAKLRLALIGISGAGKSMTSLKIASELGNKIAVIDTEHGSASKYADKFTFDVCELSSFSPERYIEAIQFAVSEGYEVVVIDSLSHAWTGKDGALEKVNQESIRTKNSFTAWGKVTPLQNKLIDTIIAAPCHIIATMRAKTEYSMEVENGKTTVRKLGMGAIQRDGMEFEFDIVGDMDIDNNLIISKSRISELSGKIFPKPDFEVTRIIKSWLEDGAAPEESPQSKGERVKRARERLGLTTQDVVSILEANFSVNNPSKLASEEVDKLIGLMEDLATHNNESSPIQDEMADAF